MNTNKTDVAGSYLGELELRLSDLPLLQRRELLADVANHIETARAEGARTEIEMIEVLERLGSPEVIAKAAYEENGLRQEPLPAPLPAPVRAPAAGSRWVVVAVVVLVAMFLLGFVVLALNSSPDPAPPVAPVAPAAPPAPGS